MRRNTACGAGFLYPDLPTGGDEGSILSYFIGKNVPVYRFVDMPASQACIALGYVYQVLFIPLPMAYLYLDSSLMGETWYYVHRYLFSGQAPVNPGVGPVSGGDGPLTLISEDSTQATADVGLPFFVPPVLSNPYVLQVTLGKPPVIVASQ